MPLPTPVSEKAEVNCHQQAALDAAAPHPNKKKIFVFCDGTGNEFAAHRDCENGNSNVVKLYTALRVTHDQVAYYHPGVGTMGDPSIRYRIPRFWSKVKGLAFGAGFKANVLDAYRYLMEVYHEGDDIYIFGFSRGAYTARALAGLLHGYGLLCRGNEGHLLYAWNMFARQVKQHRGWLKESLAVRAKQHARPQKQHSIERNFAFAETYSRNVTVRFMGIWDTVSSVGWIYKPVRLLDMAQNPIIQVGRHAVSIDERRAYYRDNLWGDPVPIGDPEWPEALRRQQIQQDIAQVWFPGVHSDVGGSYPQPEAAPANVTLKWMIDELKLHGAELCNDRIAMVLGTPSHVYAADEIFTPPPEPDCRIHDSLKGFWWLLQLFPQQYYDKEDKRIKWRVPYGVPRKIPAGSIIHESAERMMRKTQGSENAYCPRNLTLQELVPLQSPLPGTTANLDGCFVYTPADQAAKSKSSAGRWAKLVVGWITFGLFFGLLGAAAWYVVSAIAILVLAGIALVTHTLGFRDLSRWAIRFWG